MLIWVQLSTVHFFFNNKVQRVRSCATASSSSSSFWFAFFFFSFVCCPFKLFFFFYALWTVIVFSLASVECFHMIFFMLLLKPFFVSFHLFFNQYLKKHNIFMHFNYTFSSLDCFMNHFLVKKKINQFTFEVW